MEQIMSLYETVHSLVNQNDKHNLINIIIEYSKKITRSDSWFFCAKNDNKWKVKENRLNSKLLSIINTVPSQDKTYDLFLCGAVINGKLGSVNDMKNVWVKKYTLVPKA